MQNYFIKKLERYISFFIMWNNFLFIILLFKNVKKHEKIHIHKVLPLLPNFLSLYSYKTCRYHLEVHSHWQTLLESLSVQDFPALKENLLKIKNRIANNTTLVIQYASMLGNILFCSWVPDTLRSESSTNLVWKDFPLRPSIVLIEKPAS